MQCVHYIKYHWSNALNILNSYKDCLEDNNYESLRSQGYVLLEFQAEINFTKKVFFQKNVNRRRISKSVELPQN